MNITSERNATTKKRGIGWFTINAQIKESTKADLFLKKVGVNLSACFEDKIDNELYISFPFEIDQCSTKLKTLKWLRNQLKML